MLVVICHSYTKSIAEVDSEEQLTQADDWLDMLKKNKNTSSKQ